jgi:hypothetical protein
VADISLPLWQIRTTIARSMKKNMIDSNDIILNLPVDPRPVRAFGGAGVKINND